jgi:putative transposase
MHTTPLVLTVEQRQRLEALLRRPTAAQRLVERALIVLAASDGRPLRAIARDLAMRPATVRKWCRRFELRGIDGLQDRARSGRPRCISASDRCLVIATACQDPAEHGLAGHSNWSASLLAQVLSLSGQVAKISSRSVQRILQVATIKPHRCAYWKQPIDPHFEAKMRPVIDLYLNPPADGPVVCADEKTSIQALRRRFPDRLPSRPGQLRLRSVEYVRQGTRCLTAGLFVHTGKVLGLVTPTRPQEVFVDFLNLLHAHVPEEQVIHLVLDNLNTHRGTHIDAWLVAHPGRLVIYYLPFHASWLNQIELWFNTLQRRCLRLGDFLSADDLAAKVLAFIDTYNRHHAHPYRWTYTGEPLAA